MLHDNNHRPDRTNGDDAQQNIIRFPGRKPPPSGKSHPPLINLPPITKFMLGLMIGVHIGVVLAGFYDKNLEDAIYMHGGFIPASWSGSGIPFEWYTPVTLLTFSFLHAGWIHLGINTLMLAAFGSGIEKTLGPKAMLQVFVASSAAALLAHFVFNFHSPSVVVGISGAISGYFGALIMLMKQQAMLGNANNSMMPFILIWIVTTIGFGMIGAPGGGDIAWIAHLGGFFGGLGMAWWLLSRRQKPQPPRPTLH